MIAAGIALWLVAFGAPGERDGAASATSYAIGMVAVEAREEGGGGKGKDFDPSLDAATRTALGELNFKSFKKISSGKATAKQGQEVAIKIDSRYTLYVTPQSQESGGQIRTSFRIEERREEKGKVTKRNALSSTVLVVPGDKVILGGPKLAEGELVVVLTLAPAPVRRR